MKKYKKILFIAIRVFLIGIFIFKIDGNVLYSPDAPKPTINIIPDANNPETTAKTTPNANQPSPDQSPTKIDLKKHSSDILASNPQATEVPYYLLGSVSDPMYSSSWALDKIQSNRAWDLTTGSPSVVTAVIDSGFALDHEELSSRWYVNTREYGLTASEDICWNNSPENKQSNNCDDDSNGYIDDWRGYDFYSNENDPMAGMVNPNGEGVQHGTSVAGVIAASPNNAKGSAGIDRQTKIMPLQVFSDDGEATTTDIVAAIEYAVDNGADVINLSLGTNGYDSPLLAAIRYAISNNVVVVAASGNCALNDQVFCNTLADPGRMTYPALYPETIAVGASTINDQRALYSSYGSQLDLIAPGDNISPLPTFSSSNATSAYATASGTSFAAPLVAGIVSLLKSQNPNFTPTQIEFILTTSVNRVSQQNGNIFNQEYGYGRLNGHRATLLGLAKTQENLLGSRSLSPREPAIGKIWRSQNGSIASDESILVGCRIFETDECSVTIENGSIYRFSQNPNIKGDPLRYIFINGAEAPAGNWKLSVHNRNFATYIDTLIK